MVIFCFFVPEISKRIWSYLTLYRYILGTTKDRVIIHVSMLNASIFSLNKTQNYYTGKRALSSPDICFLQVQYYP